MSVHACGGTGSVTQPTPPAATPSPTTPAILNVAGDWEGVIGFHSSEEDVAYISLGLTQIGADVTGTFACLYRCVQPTGTIHGTVSGSTLTWRLVFADGSTCDAFEGMVSEGMLAGSYRCASAIATNGSAGGAWSVARLASSACVPELLSPAAGETLDNTRTGDNVWSFDWTDCPGATYHVLVMGPHAVVPAVNASVTQSSFQHVFCGFVAAANRLGWRWRVRAFASGRWGRWSGEGVFNLERPDDGAGCGVSIRVAPPRWSTFASGEGIPRFRESPAEVR